MTSANSTIACPLPWRRGERSTDEPKDGRARSRLFIARCMAPLVAASHAGTGSYYCDPYNGPINRGTFGAIWCLGAPPIAGRRRQGAYPAGSCVAHEAVVRLAEHAFVLGHDASMGPTCSGVGPPSIDSNCFLIPLGYWVAAEVPLVGCHGGRLRDDSARGTRSDDRTVQCPPEHLPLLPSWQGSRHVKKRSAGAWPPGPGSAQVLPACGTSLPLRLFVGRSTLAP